MLGALESGSALRALGVGVVLTVRSRPHVNEYCPKVAGETLSITRCACSCSVARQLCAVGGFCTASVRHEFDAGGLELKVASGALADGFRFAGQACASAWRRIWTQIDV
jgi:hypothetical protein